MRKYKGPAEEPSLECRVREGPSEKHICAETLMSIRSSSGKSRFWALGREKSGASKGPEGVWAAGAQTEGELPGRQTFQGLKVLWRDVLSSLRGGLFLRVLLILETGSYSSELYL